MSQAIWAIIVAAGEGRRFGAAKQFESLAGRPVLEWSVLAARAVAEGVVLVVPSDRLKDQDLDGLAERVVAGGPTRPDSVRAGLKAVPEEAELILVHDAARPLASGALFRAVVDALDAGADGAIPALRLSDTVKRVHDGQVLETLDRSDLVAVQTPQAFRAEVLRKAHAGKAQATDDAGLLEAIGAQVVVVDGEARNIKLTTPDDLLFARLFFGAQQDQRLW